MRKRYFSPMRRSSAAILLAAATLALVGPALAEPPRLTVVIVVDQLRGDLPARAAAVAAAGGFGKIMSGGVVYEQAFYEHATTSTAPGHATLFTGAHPSEHGIVANEWYDRASGRSTSAVRAPEHGNEPGPYNLLASTVGDELVLSCGARCQVFSVSGKDRGAILPGGRLGKAFWFDGRQGGFRSSRYYYDATPLWLEQWNEAIPAAAYPEQWTLAKEPRRYRAIDADDRPFERPPAALGRVFPHPLGHRGDPGYFGLFRHTPYLDTLTLDFVRTLIEGRNLGGDADPDLLAVSLSATDYVGHAFGPESLEAEDNLARLDRELAAFIDFLDQRVGRDRYLLVLSADHGLAATPEYAATLGLSTHRLEVKALAGIADAEIATRLHAPHGVVSAFDPPTMYLDRSKLEAAGVRLADAEAVAAEVLRRQPGIAYAFPVRDLPADPALAELVRNSLNDARSGDVYVIPEPESAIVDGLDEYTAYHGTPYAADRYVPLYFFGGHLAAQRIDRTVSTRSLATTLALVLGIPPPSHANAAALVEVTAEAAGPPRPAH
jgi:Type I phosphodiesterase / nucleotide pyrophosphatase